jgi:hypothetical protein
MPFKGSNATDSSAWLNDCSRTGRNFGFARVDKSSQNLYLSFGRAGRQAAARGQPFDVREFPYGDGLDAIESTFSAR